MPAIKAKPFSPDRISEEAANVAVIAAIPSAFLGRTNPVGVEGAGGLKLVPSSSVLMASGIGRIIGTGLCQVGINGKRLMDSHQSGSLLVAQLVPCAV